MLVLSLLVVSGCLLAFVLLAVLPSDGDSVSWKLAHLLLIPLTVISAMWVSSFLGHQPLTVDEALAQIAASPTAVPATPTDTPLPLAPTPTSTTLVSTAIASDTPSATPAASEVVPASTDAPVTQTPLPTDAHVQGVVPIVTRTPRATPTVDPSLPRLADQPDSPDSKTTLFVDGNGGRLAATDGRMVIEVPPGATDEPLRVEMKRLQPASLNRPTSDAAFVAAWELNAFAVDRSDAPVHQFKGNLQFSVRLTPEDIPGLDPQTLAFWTFDEGIGTWTALPVSLNSERRLLVSSANHFTTFGSTAARIVNLAPTFEKSMVDLHSGASVFSIPFELPPARGGFAPNLGLTYNSGRLAQMRNNATIGSWAGTGWDVDVPNIQIEYDSPVQPRVFLSMDGSGGELLRDLSEGQQAGYWIWRLRDDPYLRVRSTCLDFNCEFTVTDQAGSDYVFGYNGAAAGYRRWYTELVGTTLVYKAYRLDVQFARDIKGNQIDYTYWQNIVNGPRGQYVQSAYPKRITYNGGTVAITFNDENFSALTTYDECVTNPYDATQQLCMRKDTPRNKSLAGCPLDYVAPQVTETRKLRSAEVRVYGSRFRRYEFDYATISDTWAFAVEGAGSCPYFPPVAKAPTLSGSFKLTGVRVKDTLNQEQPFMRTSFSYTGHNIDYMDGPAILFTMIRPHMDIVTNGLGGSTSFTYSLSDGNNGQGKRWRQWVVTQQVGAPGGNQPPIVKTFYYGSTISHGQWVNPHLYQPETYDPYNGFIRGFSRVDEGAGDGTVIVHMFFATGSWQLETLTGREWATLVQDAGTSQWHKVETTWSIRPVANFNAISGYLVNFVYPLQADTTLRGGSVTRTINTFDNGIGMNGAPCPANTCYGLLTTVDAIGPPGTTSAEVLSRTAYHTVVSKWLFLPKYVEKTDVNGTLLRCTRFYYDGSNNVSTAPVLGLLTAQSSPSNPTTTRTQCEGTAAFAPSISSYTTYETVGGSLTGTYGNVARASVATDVAPETQASSGAFGWVPVGVASSLTAYDVTHVFPESQTNALNQPPTTTTFNYVLGKPTQINEPNGHVTFIVYDALGRIDHVYDNLTLTGPPTAKYIYNWGAVPNQTVVERRTQNGVSPVQSSVLCADGFGREIERLNLYSGTSFNSVRTDYDSRALKSTDTYPVDLGVVAAACPATLAATVTRNRTIYAYDPLGNITTATSAQANQTPACVTAGTITYPQPCTQNDTNGLVTTSIDGNGHRTVTTAAVAPRTLTVEEDAGTGQPGDPYVAYASTVYTHDLLGSLTNVKDANNNQTTIEYDLAGRKTKMIDPDMGTWTYTYDAAGNLATQLDARGITTTLTYDDLQRLKDKAYSGEPSSNLTPAVHYYYDTDYLGATLCPLGAATPSSAIGHLTKAITTGLVSGVPTDLTTQYSCFDSRGRQTLSRTLLNGDATNYDIRRTYDDMNRVVDLTYPDTEVVHSTYDPGGGWLNGLCQWNGASCVAGGSYLTAATAQASGAPKSLSMGDGLTTAYGYDYRQRLLTIQTGTSGAPTSTQSLTLAYDEASNVTCVGDNNDCAPGSPGGEKVNYTYDAFNRLKTGIGYLGGQTASYTYDVLGNLTMKQEGSVSLTLPYPTAAPAGVVRPHAVQYIDGAPKRWFTYDPNGNQIGSGNDAFTYDAENRLSAIHAARPATPPATASACMDLDFDGVISVLDLTKMANSYLKTSSDPTFDFRADLDWDRAISILDLTREAACYIQPAAAQSTQYIYDANGALLKRLNKDTSTNPSTTTTTVYIGGIFEQTSSSVSGITGKTKYYVAYGRAIAVRQTPVGSTETLSYLLADHLGSSVGSVDSLTGTMTTQKYWPYGATRMAGALNTDRAYTGQRQEDTGPRQDATNALGLYNYKARFYSTVTGRFVSADTIVPTADGRGLNRYSYVGNNPLTYSDPTGHCFTWLGKMQRCNKDDAKGWITCGIKHSCSADLNRMADWAIGLREFYDSVQHLLWWERTIARDNRWENEIRSIRSAEIQTWTQIPILHYRSTGAEIDPESPFAGLRVGTRLASFWINNVTFDYSYLDIRISVSGTYMRYVGDTGLQIYIRDSGRDPVGVVDSGRSGGNAGHSVEFHAWGWTSRASLFDPDVTSLRVSFGGGSLGYVWTGPERGRIWEFGDLVRMAGR